MTWAAEKRGLSMRFSAVAGDFFAAVPAADLYLLKTVLHDWEDDQATSILRNCRSATHDGGRALVVETVIGEIGKPDFATLSDMVLCVTGGIERDLEEFDALFAASGWRRDKTYPVGGGYSGAAAAVDDRDRVRRQHVPARRRAQAGRGGAPPGVRGRGGPANAAHRRGHVRHSTARSSRI
jgi:hypothetical protein